MKSSPQRRWLPAELALLLLGSACAAESADSSATTCTESEPIECRTPEGALVGCCPAAHPICSPDGRKCLDFGSGGAGSGGGGTGAAGGTPSGGSGGIAASGGVPSGGAAGEGGFGATGASGGFGGSGDTGGTGAAGSTGATGGGGASCVDVGFEPNELENDAYQLAAISDCDSSQTSVSGQLDGSGDVDFYSFYGNDQSCVVDPYATTSAKVELCLFSECTGATVSCTAGVAATSPNGNPGCCAPNGGQVALNLDCTGWNDSATNYIRVGEGANNQCTSYVITYHY